MKIMRHDKYEDIHESAKRLNTFLSRPNDYFCAKCGNELKTSYLEERFYCVECSQCETKTLVSASNLFSAEEKVGTERKRIPLMYAEMLKEKILKIFEETDQQSNEQEAYIQELRQRLSLAEKVCYEANRYLKNKDNPLGRIYLEGLEDAVKKWDSGRPNKCAQYVVTEDWGQ